MIWYCRALTLWRTIRRGQIMTGHEYVEIAWRELHWRVHLCRRCGAWRLDRRQPSAGRGAA